MTSSGTNEKFSRQVILPGVGVEGQKKWAEAHILLAGNGIALQAAAQALSSSGITHTTVLISEDFDPAFLVSVPRDLNVESIPLLEKLPLYTVALVVSPDHRLRKKLNRIFRRNYQRAVFAWPAGSGFALFTSQYKKDCPCLECFEVLNPKAFSKGSPSVERLLGAMAASEVLELILNGRSPIEDQVWITGLTAGASYKHEVQPTYKCPARMTDEGATVTP